jgi:hypothetical protein
MTYKSAKHVVNWLGEWTDLKDGTDPEACRLCIQRIYTGIDTKDRGISEQFVSWVRNENVNGILPENLDHLLSASRYLANICSLFWFYRVWTMQELALATTDPIVQIGGDLLSFERLLRLVLRSQLARPSY